MQKFYFKSKELSEYMEVNYEVIKKDDLLTIKLYTVNNTSIDSKITIVQTITKQDFMKVGNLIDRKTMPFRICYIVLKEFQKKISQMIVKSSEYIFDEDLKDKIIEYSKSVLSDEIEIVPEETFKKMLADVEQFNESIY